MHNKNQTQFKGRTLKYTGHFFAKNKQKKSATNENSGKIFRPIILGKNPEKIPGGQIQENPDEMFQQILSFFLYTSRFPRPG